MLNFNFSFINLGCNKNLVDTQFLMGKIFDLGMNNPHYEINYSNDPYNKDVKFVFLNTCGFLSSGRDEMINTAKELLKKGKKVYLIGCGLQYFKTLKTDQGDIDALKHGDISALSRNDFENITIKKLINGYNSKNFGEFKFSDLPRAYTNAEYGFEYLKIAEGCDNHCTFCIIPKIRGKQRSLAIEKIASEVQNMVKYGIQEIIFIAQDTTRYGTDLYGAPSLLKLLKNIEKTKGNFVYRLLYLYPDIISLQELSRLSRLKKLIPYFDIPLQHISSSILKKMGRFYDENYIYKFLEEIKILFPTSFMRTNIIIGFPGETDSDHKKLLEFIKKGYFDNISLFEYHDEPLAASSKLPDKVPGNIIRKRFTETRQLVNRQLLQRENKRKGKEETGYIVDFIDDEITVRPRLHAPEIDPYDEIKLNQIIGKYGANNELGIGDKIIYKI